MRFFQTFGYQLYKLFVCLPQTSKDQNMLAFANAKINIGLNITAKRPDGYHEIETVFYPIKIYDVLELSNSTTTSCVVRGNSFPGEMVDNLCYKAFKLLQQEYHFPDQQITLLKNIPVGAGLGGGSSDAAQVIKLLNDKFKLQLTNQKMEGYAALLGADCAFFIQNKPVYATGIGEKLESIELDLGAYQLVLVNPEIHVSTAEAYAGIKPKANSGYLPELMKLPLNKWKDQVRNDFEDSVFSKYPKIKEVKDALYQAGAVYAAMTGSGSSVYGFFEKDTRLPELEAQHSVYYNL
jgi:4-diphosphocytidyl-2-C-methyl-D-erythritol kinase